MNYIIVTKRMTSAPQNKFRFIFGTFNICSKGPCILNLPGALTRRFRLACVLCKPATCVTKFLAFHGLKHLCNLQGCNYSNETTQCLHHFSSTKDDTWVMHFSGSHCTLTYWSSVGVSLTRLNPLLTVDWFVSMVVDVIDYQYQHPIRTSFFS